MNSRDHELLSMIEEAKNAATAAGLCPKAYKKIKEEVLFIMGERDGLKEAIKK